LYKDLNKEWLDIKNLDYIIKGKKILSNINLNFREGEIITILGPNGSGKSTLIKLISRSIYPRFKKDSKLAIYGKETINIWEMRSKISFLNNDIHERINPKLIAKDLLVSAIYGAIGLPLRVIPTELQYKSAINLMERFYLGNKINSPYNELSDGQKRILQILRALIVNPKVIVLDEPTVNLDLKAYFVLLECLSTIANQGISLLISTNDIESIIKETTRVIFIKDGIIKEDGKTNEQLNSVSLSSLYGIDIEVINIKGYWRVLPKSSI
tara:strand:- start:1149 stop:1955 length:807 start_codon:yes stop_codon:yes gene_type:complete